jgi:hypothetical protein
VEELTRQLQDLNGLKARLTQENFELHRQVQELDGNNGALAKARALLQQQLDEAKARLDEESRVFITHLQLFFILQQVMLNTENMLWIPLEDYNEIKIVSA